MRNLAVFVCALVACNLGDSIELDGSSGTDGGELTDGDAPVDGRGVDSAGDGDAATRSGPATFVVDERGILAERICDLDGDGLPDNAIADLGSANATIMASVVSTIMQSLVERGLRSLVHFPWIDDLSIPADSEVVAIQFQGIDVVDRDDIDDDFSGEEPFFVGASEVDDCGEPRSFFGDIALEPAADGGGEIEAFVGDFLVPMSEEAPILLGGTWLSGRLEPWAQGGEVTFCGYFPARDLGAAQGRGSLGWLSWLEGLVAGGAPHGLPLLPGLSPDIDLDGDGLERFELGDDFHIVRCIDGDSTPIEGPDCWQDERIADAFAFVAWMHLVPAVFAGLDPEWNPDSCEEPPETSIWDAR